MCHFLEAEVNEGFGQHISLSVDLKYHSNNCSSIRIINEQCIAERAPYAQILRSVGLEARF